MKRKLFLWGALLVLPSCCSMAWGLGATPPLTERSLFLTTQEVDRLDATLPTDGDSQPSIAPFIFLQGVLFYNPRSWCVWINGQALSNEMLGEQACHLPPHVAVKKVSDSSVEFSYTEDDKPAKPFRLQVGQKYYLKTGRIASANAL